MLATIRMSKFFKDLFRRPTVFAILGLILIAIGFPSGLHGLTLDGGASLGGALILVGTVITAVIVGLDRFFISSLPLKKVNIIESTILLLGLTFLSFSEREIIIDLTKKDIEYFIIFENNGTLTNSELEYSFPFNKKLNFKNNSSVINSISENFQRLEVESPQHWAKQRMQPWNLGELKARFYSNGDLRFSPSKIDSLMMQEFKNVANIP